MNNKLANKNFQLFFKANLLLTIVIFLLFLQYNNNYKIVDFFLAFLGAISSAAIVYGLLYLLFFVFKFSGRFGLYLMALVFVLLDIGLLVDFFIYKLFKFHINGMVINILTSPDAMDSIQAGIAPIISFVVVILALLILQWFLIKKLFNTDNTYKFQLNSRLNKLFIIPLLLIVLSEKVAYGLSSLFTNNAVLTKFKVIPLYQPLTFNRLAAKYFDYKPRVESRNTLQLDASLNYPLKPIKVSAHPNKVNIFIFAMDSEKASVISEETTPQLELFKQDAIVLNNHHTGGNSTRFGIFSLMYGLNASYWFPIVDANKGSVLFNVLKQLSYQINITSSTNTNWPEFKNTCYVEVQDSIKDDFPGKPWKKDEQSSAYFKQWVEKQDSNRPIFSFVFLDAPHGYSFSNEMNHFNASDEEVNYLTVKPDSEEIKIVEQQYKSAVYYDDKLFGEMLDKLKAQGLYDDALIIYTSDHGQEFFEFGNFGHNTGFSSAQTKVPMVVKLPKSMRAKIELPKGMVNHSLNTFTSHTDVVPSLLSLIGVTNPVGDYSNGMSFFDKNFSRSMVVSSNWNTNSIIDSERVYVFSNKPDKIFNNEIRDAKTYQMIDGAKIESKKVLKVIKQNRRFLR